MSQQDRPLHIILPHQFVDSPEFFGVSTDELFQVRHHVGVVGANQLVKKQIKAVESVSDAHACT